MNFKDLKSKFANFSKSVWLFPFLLLIIFSIFVVFKISGSSIGFYHNILYGDSKKDISLIYGQPQAIRSDEWLVWTQITISQSENNFPRFNEDLGSGRDLSLHFEIPTKDWSAVFKPQNWSFFVLPLEYAFAFKWWFLMYVLIVGAYFFTLKLLPKNRLFAAILSTAFALSPFVLWWYQSAVLALMGYGFLIILVSIHILDGKKIRVINNQYLSNTLTVIALIYLAISFSFILYPPFQISIGIIILTYLLGYVVNKLAYRKTLLLTMAKRVLLLLVAAFVTACVGIIFISGRQEAISKMNDSIYPGDRSVKSGGQTALTVLDGFLMPLLQSSYRGAYYYSNQSEASNFIVLAPFLVTPIIWLIMKEYRKKHVIDWRLIIMVACTLLILCRMYLPFGDAFYKVILLDKVPHGRLLIALGFLGFIMLVHFLAKFTELKISIKQGVRFGFIYATFIFALLLYIGLRVHDSYPLFAQNWYEVALLAGLFAAGMLIICSGRLLIVSVAFALFTLLCSFRIMPLYQGLGPIYNSEATKTIKKNSDNTDSWLTVGSIYFEHFPLLASSDTLGGVQLYPDKNYWLSIFGDENEYTFNRKAHITFTAEDTGEKISLPQGNLIVINVSCESKIMESVDYVLSDKPLHYKCLYPIETIVYPGQTLYFYKV